MFCDLCEFGEFMFYEVVCVWYMVISFFIMLINSLKFNFAYYFGYLVKNNNGLTFRVYGFTIYFLMFPYSN